MLELKIKKEKTPAQQAATASIAIPIAIIFISNLVGNVEVKTSQSYKLTLGLLILSLLILGFVLAILSLKGIKKHGPEGIRGKAIIGLLINGLFFFASVHLYIKITQFDALIKNTPIKISMPSDYKKYSIPKMKPYVIHSYVKGDLKDKTPDILCLIETFDGRFTKNKDFSKLANSRPNATHEKTDWKEHKVDLFRITGNLNGVLTVTFNAQVPLLPNGYLVRLIGPKTREKEMREDLKNILKGIDGPTNW